MGEDIERVITLTVFAKHAQLRFNRDRMRMSKHLGAIGAISSQRVWTNQ